MFTNVFSRPSLSSIAFCIIFYLTCTAPALWIIHVDTANRKLYRLAETKLNARAPLPAGHTRPHHQQHYQQQPLSHRLVNGTSSSSSNGLSSTIPRLPQPAPTTITPLVMSVGLLECHDKVIHDENPFERERDRNARALSALQAWYYMEEQRWLDAIQETMLVVLGICRVLISREHFTIEKTGIILLLSLANGADLLAMSHSLQYHDVIVERLWMYLGLGLLTLSLFQLAFIDTDGLTAPPARSSMAHSTKKRFTRSIPFLQDQSLYSLFRVKPLSTMPNSTVPFFLPPRLYLSRMVFSYSTEYS